MVGCVHCFMVQKAVVVSKWWRVKNLLPIFRRRRKYCNFGQTEHNTLITSNFSDTYFS